MRKLIMFAFLTLISALSIAQVSVSGRVSDSESGDILIGANVVLEGTSFGAATDEKGQFKFTNVNAGNYTLVVSYLGYNQLRKDIVVTSANLSLILKLKSSEIQLKDVLVEANRAKDRETPVAFSEIKSEDIQLNLASRDVPMILNTIPGVYATMSGGGSGDARINIRGFNQRNFAVMINGVPVNDMENGWVYWSNWAGLGDVTSNLQVQRGLGATPYSVSSIGGLMNVQTSSIGTQQAARIRFETGSYNLQKKTAVLSTGLMENGFAVTAMFSHKTSDGYADRTWTDEFTYFLTVGTKFENQTFDFTIVGSPQRHGQRVAKQTVKDWTYRGLTYNSDWGYLNGKELDRVVNFYHKPAMNLNHNWQINDDMLLATVAYVSFGTGGGTGGLGTNPAVKTDGQLDWDGLAAINTASTTGSKGILRASRNDHNWYGVVSTLKMNLDRNLTLTTGIDGRYYKGIHFREITNLIGGQYYLDSSNKNRNPTTPLQVGDKVGYYNDGLVRQIGGFGQVEFKNDQLSAFANMSLSTTGYKRVDYFVQRDLDKKFTDFTGADSLQQFYDYQNSLSPSEIDYQNFLGFTFKGGVNFNIDENQNVFANAGFFSKAPGFDGVFNTDHKVYKDVVNEKILSFELGYGFRTSMVALTANAYYTQWKDKAITQRLTDPATSAFTYFYLPGLDAQHMGLEFEGRYIFSSSVEFNGMYSLALNEWKNNVETEVRNDAGTLITTKKVYADGAYVGDMPMTTAALGMTMSTNVSERARVRFNPTVNYFGRLYAQFDPDSRNTEAKHKTADGSIIQPWKMPDYVLLNLNSSYELAFEESSFKKMTITLSIFNALNETYFSDADDGANHTQNDSKVYYGGERFYNLGLSFDF